MRATIKRLLSGAAGARGVAVAMGSLLALAAPTAVRAETRGFVISTFSTATFSHPTNCKSGGNGASIDIQRRQLQRLGYSSSEIAYILQEGKDHKGRKQRELNLMRGPGGKVVDPFNDPGAAVDPGIKLMAGRYAPGFNLDGNLATGFEDPYSGAKGIDNQLLRVVGCFQAYDVTWPVRPFYEEVMWDTMTDTMPAWVVSVSGPNLRKDGPVTVTFDRALQHVRRNASGGALHDATYMLERGSRSHSVFKGTVRNGILTIAPGKLKLEGEAPIFTTLRLYRTQVSLRFKPDGSMEGFIGGYQPWLDFFYMASSAGEGNIGLDIPGLFHSFKRLADYGPHPKTGQNMLISSAYSVVAVPAFLATIDKKLVATTGGIRRTTPPLVSNVPGAVKPKAEMSEEDKAK
ncbi:hypothetical protein [Sphingopyxis sp. USTB-05]|uniref:hypothetical protein n=1 Tax=Sphingopyxis sp. USTB-05 TaxID=2830667 RepID=UPI0020784ED7|nr:hypothetical protein [Sphingopyxis sp. USTB-05]USI77615.1 hypothetical protein KEC45_01480 [Sphingopyxis sp. USTB-05]